jgi:hypothetical protein
MDIRRRGRDWPDVIGRGDGELGLRGVGLSRDLVAC